MSEHRPECEHCNHVAVCKEELKTNTIGCCPHYENESTLQIGIDVLMSSIPEDLKHKVSFNHLKKISDNINKTIK
jgi:hypothetical protein